MKRIILILWIACIQAITVFGQFISHTPEIVPASPQAAAINKYGDYPVSHYTGVPDITIPLYIIQLKEFALPITLSYNASGIKVEEEASRVGLGWNLNAGGAITSKIFGSPDFTTRSSSYFNSNITDLMNVFQITAPVIHNCQRPFMTTSVLPDSKYWDMLFNPDNWDLCPDQFFYSFAGQSGKFVINHSGEVVKAHTDNLEIELLRTTSGVIRPLGWRITDGMGNVYTFGQEEKMRPENTPTTWYLTQIKTYYGEEINFNYNVSTSYTWSYGHFVQYSTKLEPGELPLKSFEVISLTSITFPNGKIDFTYNSIRKDLSYERSLQEVKVTNSSNTKIKQYRFNYDYFVANAGGKEVMTIERIHSVYGSNKNGLLYTHDWNKHRLKLVSIDEIGSSTSDKLTTSFTYNETRLPTKLATARDHWGYYNGADSNSNLLARFSCNNRPEGETPAITSGGSANREAAEQWAQAFALKEITYPTGGKTRFDFESNKYLIEVPTEDPHRKRFMYSSHSIDMSENLSNGKRNAEFTTEDISLGHPQSNQIGVTWKITLASYFHSRPYNAVALLEFIDKKTSRVAYSKQIGIEEFPANPPQNYTKTLNPLSFSLPAGDYTIKVSGALRFYFDEFEIKIAYTSDATAFLAKNVLGIGGGLRIKRISNLDENKVLTEKEFSYGPYAFNQKIKEYVENSYGRLMYHPNYQTRQEPGDPSYSSEGIRGEGYSVGYSQVDVCDMENGKMISKTSYNFFNKPDKNLCYNWYPSNSLLEKAYDLNPPGIDTYRHPENGTLTHEYIYAVNPTSESAILKKLTVYTYNYIQSEEVWGLKKAFTSDGVYNYSELCKLNFMIYGYLYPALQRKWIRLDRIDETEYGTGGVNFQKSTSFTYGPTHKQVIRKQITNSDGTEEVVHTLYPIDIQPTTEYLQRMLSKNRKEELISVKTERNGKVYQERKQIGLFGTHLLCKSVESNTGTNRAFETRLRYTAYDTYGNLQGMVAGETDKTVYLWGYNYQYPVAEIKGADFEQVRTQLTETYINNLAKNMSVSSTLHSELRDKLKSLDVLITTYTYSPLIGIARMTAPNGEVTTYQYDGFGRLSKILNHNGKTLQQYNYHFRK
ncbi:MAG: RHS repeat protein [Bacteroides sp.]|nr:RHS repeat protein [Bacteroides sp.]